MERVLIRVIGDESVEVEGGRDGAGLLVPEAELARATGWELKPQGLCRGEVCVPVRDRSALGPDEWVDLAALGAAVGQPVAVEPTAGLAVIGHAAFERAEALSPLQAPDVRLTTVDGSEASVYDYSGRKRLVVSFAWWCGCRYDLPAW